MTRFFAHLCLFLQLIDMPVSPLATQVILEAYLRVLESAGQRELIAMYAGALGDNAVERYALFLTSLELSADVHERRLALTRAREHGLDIERVAVVTAERTIEKTFTVCHLLFRYRPCDVIGADNLRVCRYCHLRRVRCQPSSDWSLRRRTRRSCFSARLSGQRTWCRRTIPRSSKPTSSSATSSVSLSTPVSACSILLMLKMPRPEGRGRIQLSKTLLDMLPPELGSLTEPEDQATEFMHYRQFFNVWELLARVVETQALEQPQMNKETRLAWLNDYKVRKFPFKFRCTEVLTEVLSSHV